MTLHVEVVSPERILWTGEADRVIARIAVGAAGIVVVRARVVRRRVRRGFVFPSNARFGAQCGLGDSALLARALIRPRCDTAQHDALNAGRIGRPQNGAGVVQASDVVEYDDDAFRVGH